MKDSTLYFLQLKNKVPSDSYPALKQSLDNANDEFKEKLIYISFKNPIMGLIFSVLLPGIDRIYKGDLILGAFKLIYFIFVFIFFNIVLSFDDERWVILSLLLYLSAFVWMIVDIFLVYQGIKRANLKLIFNALNSQGARDE